MKNVNRLVPPKKHIQIILDLNTLFMGIRVFMYKNIQATISQRKWIKSRLIICLLLFSNYTFASLIINTPIGKELRPDNNFISMGEAKLVNSKESSTSKPNNHYTLPFTLLHNLIMIKAIVDGKEGLLLLDTGMDELILNQNHFKGTTTNDYISGVINDKGDYQRKLVPVQIGNLPEHMQYAFISNLDQLEQSLQMDILGIYGVDFLKQFQWIIHYPQRYITFHPLSKSGHPIIEPFLPLAKSYR